MGSLLIISDNGLNYSINQTSRETLFVPTSSDAQYKARAFTNMFVQRLAKGAATTVSAVFILIGIRWLSLITIAMTTGWIAIALYADRRFKLLSEQSNRQSDQSNQEEIAAIQKKELRAGSFSRCPRASFGNAVKPGGRFTRTSPRRRRRQIGHRLPRNPSSSGGAACGVRVTTVPASSSALRFSGDSNNTCAVKPRRSRPGAQSTVCHYQYGRGYEGQPAGAENRFRAERREHRRTG